LVCVTVTDIGSSFSLVWYILREYESGLYVKVTRSRSRSRSRSQEQNWSKIPIIAVYNFHRQ